MIPTVSVRSDGGPHPPARRTLLMLLPGALLGAVGVGLVAGCTSHGHPPTPSPSGRTTRVPDPDDVARERAVATARRLLADVTAMTGPSAGPRAALAEGHRAHLVALGRPAAPAPGDATSTTPARSASGSASGPPAGSPTSSAEAAGDLVAAHVAGAREALGDSADVGPDLAALLVRIAAARAAQADVVARAFDLRAPGRLLPAAPGPTQTGVQTQTGAPTRDGTPGGSATSVPAGAPGPLTTLAPAPRVSRSTADLDALARLVEAEHAAVYGYAVVVPRVARSQRDQARAVWDAHRQTRDAVEVLVVAAGVTPPAARPAYALDVPSDADGARALAAGIEAGVARVGVWSVGRGTGEVRALAADLAVVATRHRAQWLGAVPPFAG